VGKFDRFRFLEAPRVCTATRGCHSPSGLVPEGPQIVSMGVRGRNYTEWFHWVRTLEELQMERPINTCRVTVFRAHGEGKSGIGVLQQTETCNATSVDVPSRLNFEHPDQNNNAIQAYRLSFQSPPWDVTRPSRRAASINAESCLVVLS